MTRGEEVRIRISYDLLGNDAYDKVGVYVSTHSLSKKLLVYFPEFEEWGEFMIDQVERLEPDVVTTENIKFVSRIRKLDYTFLSVAC